MAGGQAGRSGMKFQAGQAQASWIRSQLSQSHSHKCALEWTGVKEAFWGSCKGFAWTS